VEEIMPTLTRSLRGDAHFLSLAGKIRNISGKPIANFTDATSPEDHAVGAVAYDYTNERFYINTSGTIYGWKYLGLT
jgi:hypothetical protein